MTRQIKFRAWDGIKITEIKTLFLDMKYKPNIHIMQFTGLLDKNGKEIYESDLVKFKRGGKELTAEIFYHNGMFCLKYNDGYINEFPLIDKLLEVIGNIYDKK